MYSAQILSNITLLSYQIYPGNGFENREENNNEYFALDFAYKAVQNCEGEAEVI